MLHVADDVVRPVAKVDRAIRPDADADGAEVRQVFRLGRDEVLHRFAFQAGAVLSDFHAVDALEGDDVDVEKISLELVGEMPAAEDARTGTRARGALPKIFQVRMLAGVEQAAERGAEVGIVPGRVGHDVVAPVVEDAPVRVGKIIADVKVELARARLETIDGAVGVAQRTGSRLYLRAVKHAVAEVNRAARFVADRVRRVMRVGAVHAHEDALLPIGPAVAVGIAHEPQVRRLHDQYAVAVKLKAGRAIQIVEEGRRLVRAPVAVGVLEDEQLVADFAGRRALGVIAPR